MSRQLLSVVCLFLGWSFPARGELPPLIPRKVLFGNPSKASPSLSPDAKQLAYLAPDDQNVLQVWVETLGEKNARKVTADKKRGIRMYRWTYAPHTLIYAQDHEGDENFHVYRVNLETDEVKDLTPFPGVRAQPMSPDRNHPDELLVSLNKTNPRLFDVYRINLKTADITLDTKNPGDVVGWETDPQYRIRAAQAFTRNGGAEVRYRPDDKSPWKTIIKKLSQKLQPVLAARPQQRTG